MLGGKILKRKNLKDFRINFTVNCENYMAAFRKNIFAYVEDKEITLNQIAEAADTVMIIKRDNKDLEEVVDGRTTHYDTVTIKIEKGRNIGTGEFGCRFYYSRCLFTENDQDNDNSDPLGEVTQERTKDRW